MIRSFCAGFAAVIALSMLPTDASASSFDGYCRYSTREEVLFVDLTTELLPSDKDHLARILEQIESGLKAGDRLTLRTITDAFTTSLVLFSDCMPGCPETSLLNSIFSECNPTLARSDHLDFEDELAYHAHALFAAKGSYPLSDIVRTIFFASDGIRRKPRTEYILFSDMLENSDLIRWPLLVRRGAEKNIATVRQHRMIADLKGVRVRVVAFGNLHDGRNTALTTDELNSVEAFWDEYFSLAGATVAEFDRGGD